MSSLNDFAVLISTIVIGAAAETKKEGSNTFTMKGAHDVLSAADLSIDKYLRKELSRTFRNAIFITEETCAEENVREKFFPMLTPDAYPNKDVFVIDPIDGSSNFAVGSPNYGVSVAMLRNGEPRIGVVYLPAYDELYISTKGGKSYRKNLRESARWHELRVRDIDRLMDSMTILEPTGRPALRSEFLPICQKLYPHVGNPMSLNCSVVQGSFLAAGRLDAMICPGYPWDMCAIALIIQNAGGVTRELDGSPWKPWSKSGAFACTQKLSDEIINILKGDN